MVDFLIFSPHPDDAELAMGGTIARLCAEGRSVALVDVTSGEPTPHGNEEVRRRESDQASRVLGLATRENLGLTNRWLEVTIENRKLLAAAIRRHRPRTLFIPFPMDAHPDHLAVHDLALRARFDAQLTKADIPGQPHHTGRIVHFYCTHLRLAAEPSFVVDISDYAQTKRRAVECYQSQFYLGRDKPGEVVEYVMTTAAYFGQRIHRQYAEPFHVDEPLSINLESLL